MKQPKSASSANSRPLRCDSEFLTHSHPNLQLNPNQLVNYFISDDDVSSLRFDNIKLSDVSESENACQSHRRLSHFEASSVSQHLQERPSKRRPLQKDSVQQTGKKRSGPPRNAVRPANSQKSFAKAPDEALTDQFRTEESAPPKLDASMPHDHSFTANSSAANSSTANSSTPWQGIITSPAYPTWKKTMQTPVDTSVRQKTRRSNSRLRSTQPAFPRICKANQGIAKVAKKIGAASTLSASALSEPRRQPTTYQLPNRSKEVTFGHAITLSFPRLAVLFLVGVALACAVGIAFPSVVSWLELGNMVSVMMRSLFITIALSLAIAFALEFR